MKLQPCAAMADEPGWGHFIRLAIENGLHGPEAIRPLLPKGYKPAHRQIAWRQLAGLLSGTEHPSQLDAYLRKQCIFRQIFESNHLLEHVWRRLENRWAFHHGLIYAARLSVLSCPECVKEDIGQHGFSWYRQGHQLPGADWCWLHLTPLCEVPTELVIVRSRQPWTLLKLPAKPTSQRPIPRFVRRYLQALEWLRQPKNHPAWHAVHTVLSETFLGKKASLNGWMEIDERISAGAPKGWYFPDSNLRYLKSRYFSCPEESQSPVLAMRAAFFTRSEADLDQLFAKTDVVLDAQQEPHP